MAVCRAGLLKLELELDISGRLTGWEPAIFSKLSTRLKDLELSLNFWCLVRAVANSFLLGEQPRPFSNHPHHCNDHTCCLLSQHCSAETSVEHRSLYIGSTIKIRVASWGQLPLCPYGSYMALLMQVVDLGIGSRFKLHVAPGLAAPTLYLAARDGLHHR